MLRSVLAFLTSLPVCWSLHAGPNAAQAEPAAPTSCSPDLCAFRAKSSSNCSSEHAFCNDDLLHLLCLLRTGKPFAFAHFNDGEVKAATSPKGLVDRDWQKASKELQTRMGAAIVSGAPNTYKGLACRGTFPSARKWLSAKLANASDCFHTGATVFIDQNHARARQLLPPILQKKRVHVLAAAGARVQGLPFKVASTVSVPDHDAFAESARATRELDAAARDGDVVLLMAGPLGRILAMELFAKRPRVTFLELGSFWDQELDVGLKGAAGWKDHPCD